MESFGVMMGERSQNDTISTGLEECHDKLNPTNGAVET
jgi:hypothetical protein